MASLLRLYQQDAEACDPALTQAPADSALWVAAATEYLARLRDRFNAAQDVPVRQKRFAAECLDLAVQSLRAGVRAGDAVPVPVGAAADNQPSIRSFLIMLSVMFVVLLINLWVMSVIGVASLSGLIAAFVLLHWGDVAVLERRLRSGRSSRAASRAPAAVVRSRTVSGFVESVVRQIDAMIERDARPETVQPTASLSAETLAFFQDILEAKLAGDRDFAFKKISRTIEQVLSSEDIVVVTDVQDHAAMFTIDTIADAAKAGTMDTIRPALVSQSRCIMTGYAHRFVNP